MVIQKWWFILRYFLFWMGIFACYRLLFLIIYFEKFKSEGVISILANFYYGLYLDASTACYLLALPVILLGLAYLLQRQGFIKAINSYTIFFIFIYGFIALGEVGLYGEWGTKLNYQALLHLLNLKEAFSTVSTFLIITFFGGNAILGGLFTWFYWRKIRLPEIYTRLKYTAVRVLLGIVIIFINAVVVFLGMRGGWNPIPISQSVAYYSHNPVLNDASVNAGWNFISNISENYYNLNKNPFVVMPMEEAKKIVGELYETPNDSSLQILTTDKPNICFLILESWSANMVGSCGGMKDVTPFFDSLSTAGVLFDNMTASAGTSEQGITAVLSGQPHTFRLYFSHQADKTKKMACLSKTFHAQGYSTAFYFGGQLSYGNLKGYLFNQDFDVIKEGDDFDASISRARLGIHDGLMMPIYASALNQAKQPFMYSMFTLSSHMPYDIPVPHKFDYIKTEGLYTSSMNYTDASLREFFSTVKKMPWYKNTLFVLVADHSHNSPIFQFMQSAEFNHIPCLFFGEVIKNKYKGLRISRKVMQADIAATVLHQCKLDASDMHWSRNMLNPNSPQWAFYPLFQGGGITDGKDWVAFDTNKESYYMSNSTDSVTVKQLRKKGEALQQVLFDEFLKY